MRPLLLQLKLQSTFLIVIAFILPYRLFNDLQAHMCDVDIVGFSSHDELDVSNFEEVTGILVNYGSVGNNLR